MFCVCVCVCVCVCMYVCVRLRIEPRTILVVVETGYHYVSQAGLELVIS
jgi:hypothetical protein